jgi:glycine reductase
MRLELHRHKIENAEFDSMTRVEGHTLLINKKELVYTISEISGLMAEVIICRPGDSVRITNILDIMQPRIKSEGGQSFFPGFLASPERVGKGITKVLDGVAVVEVAAIPRVQEGLIDMSGRGADYSPFAKTQNIVLIFLPKPGTEIADLDRRIRKAGLAASVYLAMACLENDPEETEVFDLNPDALNSQSAGGLKRIAYVYMLQSQGLLRDTYFYGNSVRDLNARYVHPNEIMDGAIVSGNYVIPSNRNPTYFHENNPVVRELYRGHQKDYMFCGVIICNEHSKLKAKEKTAQEAVGILTKLGVYGAVITKEGGGNADTDLMLMCQASETAGVKTVILGNEAAGPEGADPSLAHTLPAADAFVTTGNTDQPIELDPVAEVIGCGPLPGMTKDLKESLIIPVGRINGACSLLGYSRLSTKAH